MSDASEMQDGSNIDAAADANQKKKRVPTWVWIVGGVLVLGLVLQSCGGDSGTSGEVSGVDSSQQTPDPVVAEPPPSATEEPASPPAVSEPEPSGETIGEANARKKAESYLSFSAFSRTGLIGQLEFEGFSTEESEYAVDAVNADWNEQAALKAQSYLDFSSFSRQGLIDQLLFEGFTQSEAEYGVTQVGY